jgi:hypothetical protein
VLSVIELFSWLACVTMHQAIVIWRHTVLSLWWNSLPEVQNPISGRPARFKSRVLVKFPTSGGLWLACSQPIC